MKSVVGLLEYTVTGAFVWLVSLILVGWIAADAAGNAIHYSELLAPQGPDDLVPVAPQITILAVWSIWATELFSLPAQMLESSRMPMEIISAMLGGAFFVTVFVTGALVELAASTFVVVFEATLARRMFRRSDRWLRKLVAQHGRIVLADYRALLREGKGGRRPKAWQWVKYRRVTTFLHSYALANAKPAQVEDLLDRLKLWRVNQAICLSLVVVGIAIGLWWLWTGQAPDPAKVLVLAALVAVSIGAMLMTFFRLVTALEVGLYLSYMEGNPGRTAQSPPTLTAVPSGVPSANAGTRASAPAEIAAQRSAA